jgi:peptidoglycan-associated lipoprotein
MGFGKPEALPEARVTEPATPPLMASAAPTEAAPAPTEAAPAPDRLAALAAALADVYYDYDRAAIRNDGKAALEQDARLLKAENGWKLLISGHCDERGTLAYNLVLGERRAQSAKRYLGDLGVPATQIQITSYGKEKPFCTEHNKDCWQKNRRAHLALQ